MQQPALPTGSLSHSTVSFFTEKDVIQTLLQPRRVFLLPSTCPRGHSCKGWCSSTQPHESLHTGPGPGTAGLSRYKLWWASALLRPSCHSGPRHFLHPREEFLFSGYEFHPDNCKTKQDQQLCSLPAMPDQPSGWKHFGHHPELIAWTSQIPVPGRSMCS